MVQTAVQQEAHFFHGWYVKPSDWKKAPPFSKAVALLMRVESTWHVESMTPSPRSMKMAPPLPPEVTTEILLAIMRAFVPREIWRAPPWLLAEQFVMFVVRIVSAPPWAFIAPPSTALLP